MAKKGKSRRPTGEATLPSQSAILEFIRSSGRKVGKREIAREFGLRGSARIALKRMLTQMADDGTLVGTRRELRRKGTLPPVAVLNVSGSDEGGDLIAEPAVWDQAEGERPKVLLMANRRQQNDVAIGIGDRVLARITTLAGGKGAYAYQATPIRRLPRDQRRLLGIFRTRRGGGGTIDPIDRRQLRSWPVQSGDEAEAQNGDLVRFNFTNGSRHALTRARVLECLGNPDTQRQISLIAIHAHGLRETFPDHVLAEASNLKPATVAGRDDLRDLPLVTIDPEDARDHDDAVFAAADTDPKNRGGFVVVVAIADVAHYVSSASRIDKEAQLRANSVYFPDRVVPMLPEHISNDLCSLREDEDRPCLAVRMIFNERGEKVRHTFSRGLMRSRARLSYQQVQHAFEGSPPARCRALMNDVLEPLLRAYDTIKHARDRRGPLDLELPERRIILDASGRVDRVVTPERLDAHRLIEELMIQANVAAAETLERQNTPLIYRVHDQPAKDKLKSLRDFLATLNLKVPGSQDLRPAAFNRILHKAKQFPTSELIQEVVLRAQAQAEYAPGNIGHFGLNLARYTHFTSPIRRYADLVVHRALIRALRLGPGGLTDADIAGLADIARSISEMERRAMAAERETTDRLLAAYLSDRVGATFDARISGVTRAGVFVRLRETGADGFIPMSTLSLDYFHFVEDAMAIVGDRTGITFRLGDPVEVRLAEAIATAGALRFEMLSDGGSGPVKRPKGLSGKGPGRQKRRRPR